jgi:DNA-nicking Smr family endonuclease
VFEQRLGLRVFIQQIPGFVACHGCLWFRLGYNVGSGEAKIKITRMNDGTDFDENKTEPVSLPVDGVLDLHAFRPRDVKGVVMDYLVECRERGILQVRVIHGKGIGQLRQTVHSILAKHPDVVSFALAGEAYGGSGATIVHLRPR